MCSAQVGQHILRQAPQLQVQLLQGEAAREAPHPLPSLGGGVFWQKAAVCAKTQGHLRHDLERKAEEEGRMESKEPGRAGASQGAGLTDFTNSCTYVWVMPPMIYY